MKKMLGFLIMALLIISAVSVFADGDTNTNISTAETAQQSSDNSSGGATVAQVRENIREHRINNTERVIALREAQIARFNESRQDIINKFRNWSDEQVAKFAALRQDQIAKFTALRQDQLQRFKEMRQDQIARFANLSQVDIDKLALLTRARIDRLANLTEDQIKERLDGLKIVKVKREELYMKRQISKDNLDLAKVHYDNAEQAYTNAKEKFIEEKASFDMFKNKNETKAIESAKKFLNHAGEMIIKSFEKIKAQAQSNTDLSAEDAQKIVADADANIANVTAAMEKINASVTKADVKAAGQAIIESWNNLKKDMNLQVGIMVNAKVGEIIQRSEQLETKLDKIIAKMENKSIDTSSLNAEIGNFSAKVEEARAKYEQASALFKEVNDEKSSTGNITQDMANKSNQAHDLVKEAHSLLKDANNILMGILKETKQKGGDVNVGDEDTVNVVENVNETA